MFKHDFVAEVNYGLTWSTMTNPYFLQSRLAMGDHGQHYCNLTFMVDQGQTMVISLP